MLLLHQQAEIKAGGSPADADDAHVSVPWSSLAEFGVRSARLRRPPGETQILKP